MKYKLGMHHSHILPPAINLRYTVQNTGCILTILFIIVVGMFIKITPAQADGLITVTTTADVIANDGLCSLREAIIAANTDTGTGGCSAGNGADAITFSPSLSLPAVFTLSQVGANENNTQTGDLDIVGTLTISGTGTGDSIIIDGNSTDRIFEVLTGAHVTIWGVTIQHGNPGLVNDGGGIKVLGALTLNDSQVQANQGGGIGNNGGSLTLHGVTITNNPGGYGIYNQALASLDFNTGLVSGNQGGIYNATSTAILSNLNIISNTGGGVRNTGASLSHLTVQHSTVMTNTATNGAGIFNDGIGAISDVHDTRLSGNIAIGAGGGAYNTGVMNISGSVLDHNQARSGGGVEHFGGNLHLTNDTLSGNHAIDNGGGLSNRSNSIVTNVTFNANTTGGVGSNIFNDEAQLSIASSIVAQGTCANSSGFFNSLGYNLDSGNTCGFSASGDMTNTNPQLGPLQDNGGPTFTHALLAGSPALDQIPSSTNGCGTTVTSDQRGVSRPQGVACDMGAYEAGPVPNNQNYVVYLPLIFKNGGNIVAAPARVALGLERW